MDGSVEVYDASGNRIGVVKAADISPLATPPAPGAAVVKSEEQRFVLGIAYQAGRDPRIRNGLDGARDFFTEAELEKAAWSFMLHGQQVNMFHVDGTEGAARPVESFIYRNPVPWIVSDDAAVCKSVAELAREAEALAGPDDLVVRKGDWGLGAILEERPWRGVKDGRVGGWSPQGEALRRRTARPA